MLIPPDPIIISPNDEHNQTLLKNVHPVEWINPDPVKCYNLVVIGAGTAGLVTAAGAAGLGAKVALIEKQYTGGDCLNTGCVPSKALIRAARAFAQVRDAGHYGVDVSPGVCVDFPRVMKRMRRLRAQISSNDSAQRFAGLGVDLFFGEAKFVAPNAIDVLGKRLSFSKAVIASGARAAELPIPGLKEAGAFTNETIFSLTELPRRLAVIGAGPIGCEMAQTFARFGSQVYMLEVAEQILIREDSDAAKRVEAAIKRDGVEIVTNCKIKSVSMQNGERVIQLNCMGKLSELTVDAILIGVGRTPNVERLNLTAAGIQYDRNGVTVEDTLRTTNPNVYAAGDICSPYKFTHAADAAARIVIQNALFMGKKKVSALTIPWCTYTDPEIAHVGLYEREAREKGIAVDTFIQEFAEVDRAILDGESEGFIKVHVEKGTDHILGATIVAPHAGEMINELTLAITAKLGLSQIAKTIHPYPTQAEAIKKVADAYNRTRLTPFIKTILARWLGLRRLG
jgi:pyruvate/2-oxoglutarate dehydrogenase complex dihydrolipoamide dehydrogenase (E3) component